MPPHFATFSSIGYYQFFQAIADGQIGTSATKDVDRAYKPDTNKSQLNLVG